jgi:hypothetical protein
MAPHAAEEDHLEAEEGHPGAVNSAAQGEVDTGQEEACADRLHQAGMAVDEVDDRRMVPQCKVCRWVEERLPLGTTTTTTTRDHRRGSNRHTATELYLVRCHQCQLDKLLRWTTAQAHHR